MDESLEFGVERLEALGLSALRGVDAAAVIDRLRAEVELRVGMLVAASLSDEQLHHFAELMSNGAKDDASAWFDYVSSQRDQIVRTTDHVLTAEVHAPAPEILAAFGHPVVES